MAQLFSLGIVRVMANNDTTVPRRVLVKILAVVVPCLLIPFILAGQIGAFLWHRFIPYLVFGIEEVRRQSIAVTESARGYVSFSNGVTIHGWRWASLELLLMAVEFCLFIGLSFLLLRGVAWIIGRRDRTFSHEILYFWRKSHDA